MQFLSIPNLPDRKVGYVIVDYRTNKKIITSLEKQGITVFFSCKIDTLYDAVCGHPDMSICHLGGADFVCEPSAYEYYSRTLTLPGINLIKGETRLTCTYPYDIAYNIAYVSGVVFHKKKYTDKTIAKNLNKARFIDVSQGYSKCSTCIVAENAIITDDDSIYAKAYENGIDALKIRKGVVALKGFEYGFIGGATGLISNDTLAITGNVEKHVDWVEIFDFCARKGVKVYTLTDDFPVDIGSIIPIAYA